MENLFFFPTIDEQMLEDSGCYGTDYEFGYYLDGTFRTLNQAGNNTVRLEDPLDVWNLDNDGLRIMRAVTIEYPGVLKGPQGVICTKAELGVCIIWNNRFLKQMGYILPAETIERDGKKGYIFSHYFPPGEILGDLILNTVIYVKKSAETVENEEEHLINETGVTVGTIDSMLLNFSNTNMEFPMVDVNDNNQPLWWLELNQWEDPRKDPFNEDYVCLYLNSYYECCPKVGESIKNLDLLIEIISSAYLLIFQKIEDMGFLNATLNDDGLEPGSISKVMFYFYSRQLHPLKFEPGDALLKSIHQNVEAMLKGNNE